jgi:hypothetical protein
MAYPVPRVRGLAHPSSRAYAAWRTPREGGAAAFGAAGRRLRFPSSEGRVSVR